ncbi:PepSY domain-containing protein [Cochleicola gelatinilyticus]|uniref:Oxidoreductase n=1 Tax=Cochleicola gelatinilyticus TaxID=1763537 RepID=A0A167IP95_9FLAO|nr:PepSY domain-containing protein [Cochleicola gelatinilyticus]OAB79870.1 oxidoreductase [Cochleicola gelatinilyticus]
MTISVWRYSHFLLAIVSSLFLLIASVTGVILAMEPITHQAKGYAVTDLNTVSVGTTINALQKKYDEVFELEVEPSGFVKASVLTQDLETKDIYIDPITSEALGEVPERPFIYSFSTNLHRSLFLKTIGRVFVGLISLILCFIAVTGIVLLAKRQGGIKKLFAKVQKEYFEMRYHVVLSRWFFIPILIVAATGVYLSAEKFDLLPKTPLLFEESTSETAAHATGKSFFETTTLNEIRSIAFPFSEDPEEYFQVSLQDKEVKVHQVTGAVVSSAPYPFVTLASRLSLALHTGEGSVLWSIVLLLASASIVFFMYSGFVMTLKRLKNTKKPPISMPDKDRCEYVILVGSETGKTYTFAQSFFNALTHSGKKVYLTELNNYTTFEAARHVIVFTATYGEGEATTNARKFETIFSGVQQPHAITYSVVGFGSLEYPDYCQFAIKVDGLLQMHSNFQPVLPLYKINNSDISDFKNWIKKWSEVMRIPLHVELSEEKKKKLKQLPFKVVKRTELNIDDTFIIHLQPLKKVTFVSGDLLHIFPEGSTISRPYSIAKIEDTLVLSIKKHDMGKASNLLYNLPLETTIHAAIETNKHFHFPKKNNSVILIANGTGIAPFLGMLHENKEVEIHLFWGGRTKASVAIYQQLLDLNLSVQNKLQLYTCFSREDNKEYVQDLVAKHPQLILNSLKNNGCLMLCGSLSMQHGVLETLEVLLASSETLQMDDLLFQEQLKMDCY